MEALAMRTLRPIGLAFVLTFVLAAQGTTEVVPQSVGGGVISADGRYVLHTPGALVYDSATGQTTNAGLGQGGVLPNFTLDNFELSGNGQFVAYGSWASNLLPGVGGPSQVYVLDRSTGVLEVVSKSSSGTLGDSSSHAPSLSDDGRYVAFYSYASNLVAGDTNGAADVFVHDRLTHVTTRVSVNGGYQATAGSAENRISGDGAWVYFRTTDLALAGGQLVLHHLPTGATTCPLGGTALTDPYQDPRISRHGQHLAYGDTLGRTYRRDLWNGVTTPISVLPNGTHVSSEGELSADGGYFLFGQTESLATGLVMRKYLRDIAAGVTHMVGVDSAGTVRDDVCWLSNPFTLLCNGAAGDVSDFGRHVTFTSSNPSVAPGDVGGTDANVFIHHRTPHLGAAASVSQGTTAALAIAAVEHPGKGYVVALSTGYTPGILVDWRWAPLVPSDLLTYSLTPSAPYLVGFQGTLDASGTGSASVQVPVAPGLSGASFYASFAVLDPSAASGIAAFSNAAKIMIN
jgi:hypothetical protein